MNKDVAKRLYKLTNTPKSKLEILTDTFMAKFLFEQLSNFRLKTESRIVDMVYVIHYTFDMLSHFFNKTMIFIAKTAKKLGIIVVLEWLAFLLLFTGCAAHETYFAHLWCKSSGNEFSFGVYTQDDGKLVIRVYNADLGCAYVKDANNMVIENDNQTVK